MYRGRHRRTSSGGKAAAVAVGGCLSVVPGLGLPAHGDVDRTRRVIDVVRDRFPAVRGFAEYCPADPDDCAPGHVQGSDHYSGDAVDLMMLPLGETHGYPRQVAAGDAIVAYLIAHAERFGVTYIIWRGEIWTPDGDWQPYTHPDGRAGATWAHMDHIHVSTLPGAVNVSGRDQGRNAESDSPAPKGRHLGVDTARVAAASEAANAPAERDVYVVQRGDTLSEIAEAHDTNWIHLFYDMPQPGLGPDPDLIHPGQRVNIAGHEETA